MSNNESNKNKQQLPLANVINWVAVSHTNPPEGEHATYFVRDDMGFMYERNGKDIFGKVTTL